MIESVSLAEVVAAARGRHASLVPETSGYILLGVIRAMGGRPMKVDPLEILLNTEGGIAIEGPRQRRAPAVTAAGLQELLRRLLQVGQGNPTTLRSIAQPVDGAPVALDKLFTGVTRALIPINRSAAKRALARLARETLRAKARGLIADDHLEAAVTGWEEAAERATSREPSQPGVAETEPAEARPEIDAAPGTPSGPPVVEGTADLAPAPTPELRDGRTPSPTPSVRVDVASEDEWDDIDADIDLLTPTPRPTIEPTPTLMDPHLDEQHRVRDAGVSATGTTSADEVAEELEEGPTGAAAAEEVPPLPEDESAEEDVEPVPAEEDVEPVPAEEDVLEPAPDEVDVVESMPTEEDVVEPVPDEMDVDVSDLIATPAPRPVTIDAQIAEELEPPLTEARHQPAIEESNESADEESAHGVEASLDETAQNEATDELAEADPSSEREPSDDELPEPSDRPSVATPAAGGAQLDPAQASEQPAEPDDDAEPAPEPRREPLTETELAETLLETAAARGRKTPEPRAPAFAKSPHEQGSVEDLLDRLDAGDREDDPVLAAAASLKLMMGLDLSPSPAAVVDDFDDEPAEPRPSLLQPPTTPHAADEADEVDDLDDLEGISASLPLQGAEDDEDHAILLAPSEVDVTASEGDVPATARDESELDDDAETEHDLDDAQESVQTGSTDDPPVGDASPEATPDEELDQGAEGVAQSISPPPAAVTEELTEPGTRRDPRWAAWLSAAALLGGGGLLATQLLGQSPLDLAREHIAGASTPEPSAGTCVAELRLHDLPDRHEILIGLGEAPLTTRPLPTGVRLEMVATAPDHQPERVVIPVDANWVEIEQGERQLAVSMSLERGVSDHWPPAPAGSVGGTGAAGKIQVATDPGAEIWLVAAAGRGPDTTITVSCGHDANLLILDPTDPQRQRRLAVAAKLLDAAARSGGADLSGKL